MKPNYPIKLAHDQIALRERPHKGKVQLLIRDPWTGTETWQDAPNWWRSEKDWAVRGRATPSVCEAAGCKMRHGLVARNAGAFGVMHICQAHIPAAENHHQDAMDAERENGRALAQILKDERRMMRGA